MISSQTVQVITTALGQHGAILLRGRDSILRGEDQNDIDLFLPRDARNSCSALAGLNVERIEPTGTAQQKIWVSVPETAQTAVIDLFRKVTWRGIPIIDVTGLPRLYCSELGLECLTRDAEIWLTVLKNALHSSPTSPHKLSDIMSELSWPVSQSPNHRFEKRLALSAWTVARSDSTDRRAVMHARLSFIMLRMLEAPLGTSLQFARWTIWKAATRNLR